MGFVLLKREKEVLEKCYVKSIYYLSVPTLKLIQAARTKEFLLAGSAG